MPEEQVCQSQQEWQHEWIHRNELGITGNSSRNGAEKSRDSCYGHILRGVLLGAGMPSCHHIGFQQCPFQVHMMVIQSLVDSSQNLETGRLNTDLCLNFHLNFLWKASSFLRSARWIEYLNFEEKKLNFAFSWNLWQVAALETPLLLRWLGYHSSYLLDLSLQTEVLKEGCFCTQSEIQNAYNGSFSGNPKAWILLLRFLFSHYLTVSNWFLWSSYEVPFWSKVFWYLWTQSLHRLATDLRRGGEEQGSLTFSVTYWQRWRSWSPSGKISGSTMGTKPF